MLVSSISLFFQYRRLVCLGGSSIKGAVKYIMDTVMTNEMQTKFNWEGRIGWKTKDNEFKRGFKKTNVCYVITSKLKLNCCCYVVH